MKALLKAKDFVSKYSKGERIWPSALIGFSLGIIWAYAVTKFILYIAK